MKRLGAFLWDFVVGDDWVGAAGVAILLAVAAGLEHLAHVAAWLLLPPGVSLVLAATLRRAVKAAAPAGPSTQAAASAQGPTTAQLDGTAPTTTAAQTTLPHRPRAPRA